MNVVFISCAFEKNEVKFKGISYKASAFDSIIQRSVNNANVKHIDLRVGLKDASKDPVHKVHEFLALIDKVTLFFPETTDKSIIGAVSKVIKTNDRVYVLDNQKSNALFVFDHSGKFLHTVGDVGKGPGEFVEPTDFEINEAEGQVYIYDQFRSVVNKYDLGGRYLGNFKLPFRNTGMVKLGNDFVFQNLLGNDHIKVINKSALTITDTLGNVTKVGLPMLRYNYISDRVVRMNDSTAHHMIPYNDTIYHITPKGIYARYVFLFPEAQRLPQDFMKQTGPIYERFRELFPSNRFTYYESGCWETNTHVMATVYHVKDYCTILYSKQTGNTLVVPNNLNSEDFCIESLILMLNRPISGNNNDFIIPVYMPSFAENLETFLSQMSVNKREEWLQAYPVLKKWRSDDNPMIVFLSFKPISTNKTH
ncbi:MAG: 6-bladed beta-propeller [Bacteroidales bacterium]|nr:6-bladed beta-propeller [Bacteroidales bacterium]